MNVLALALLATVNIAAYEPVNTAMKIAAYRGREAVQLVRLPDSQTESMLAIVKGRELKDGTIEVDVAGLPRPDAPPDSRGFIGIAFHVESGDRYECIYIRPTNARADDQLRRNHTTQYVAHPDAPWHELRKSDPGKYESYVDMEAGAWTKLKIVIAGTTAKLYVNGAAQPCLVVKDLKHGGAGGGIALWSHMSTDGYFSNLKIAPR